MRFRNFTDDIKIIFRTRKMSREMKEFLMSYYEPRENKPWNAWKTIRKNQMDQGDVSDGEDDDDSSSEDENERLERFLQASRSSRRKTFEMWLTDKEAELARKQTLLAEKAKQEVLARRKENNWRQLTGKTYGEWLEEKGEFRSDEAFRGKPGEQSEARKAAAARKYQEWLRSKDEEALAREDSLRREAAEKFSVTKQKRDEKMQRAWFKKKLFNTS